MPLPKVWSAFDRLDAVDLNADMTYLDTRSGAISAARRQVVGTGATLVLTQAAQDVPGLTFTLGAGTFMILAVLDADIATTGAGAVTLRLSVDGVEHAVESHATWSATGRGSLVQLWLVTIAGAGLVKARALKSSAGGVADIYPTHSTLAVI